MLEFRPIFDSYWLVALLGLGLFALLAIPPSGAPLLTRRQRHILVGLRAATHLALLLAMLRPTFVWTKERTEPATVALMVDVSRSMTVADEGVRTRWTALRDALDKALPKLAEQDPLLQVQWYEFAREARALSLGANAASLPREPNGAQSDIGGALSFVAKQEATRRLAAVALLSDGAQRATTPRGDATQAARELARRGVPIYTVKFGRERAQSEARDVAVADFPDQFSGFVNNELRLRGSVRAQGFSNQPIPVELRVVAPDQSESVLGPQVIRVEGDDLMTDVEFRFTPTIPGEYRLALKAKPQADESITENNVLESFLNVLEGGIRVLYVDGNVAWQEQKFVRRAIDGSPDMELDYVWIDPRGESRWPFDLKGYFSRQAYDVCLLGDVHSAALGTEQAAFLAARIEQGMGLAMLGGAQSFGAGGYAQTIPLRDALPVIVSPLERRSPNQGFDERLNVSGELAPHVTEPHFITRLSDGDNVDTWSGLPPFAGANRLAPKPASRVLLEGLTTGLRKGEPPHPLLVVGEYGRGRVVASGVDSTYRWFRKGFAREHQRFWRQMILWLARKDAALKDAVWLELRARRFASGSALQFTAGMRDAQGMPVTDVQLTAEIERQSQEAGDLSDTPLSVTLTPANPDAPKSVENGDRPANDATADRQSGLWLGETQVLAHAGPYELTVVARRDGEIVGSASASFVVSQQDLELIDPAANPLFLAALSDVTKEAGGKSIAAEELGGVFQELAERRRQQKVEYVQSWRLGDTTIDAWLAFSLIAALLSAEWYLRKRWRLA